MAKLSKKSCHPEAPAAAVEPAPRVALCRKPADQRLWRFRFFSCFRVSPKPVDKFLAETAKRGRPEMAPQRLEKIESAPGNGMAPEASMPQHLVYGRVAHRALRRNSLGPPPTAQRPRFTNSKRRKANRKFSASQPLEIAQNRNRIAEAPIGSV